VTFISIGGPRPLETQNSFDRTRKVRCIGFQKIAVRTRSESHWGDVTTAILSEEYLRKLPNSAGGIDELSVRKADVKELFGLQNSL